MPRLSRPTAQALVALVGISVALSPSEGVIAEEASSKPHVVFVTGDDEYGSETSMPMIAEILAQRHGMTTTVLYAENDQGERDRHGHSILGLDALRTADLAVFFMRFRALPQEQ